MKRDERKKEMLCTTVLGPLAGRIAVRLAGRYVDTLNHLLFRQAYQWNFPCSPHQKNTSKEELSIKHAISPIFPPCRESLHSQHKI